MIINFIRRAGALLFMGTFVACNTCKSFTSGVTGQEPEPQATDQNLDPGAEPPPGAPTAFTTAWPAAIAAAEDCSKPGSGKVYEVGPGKELNSINAVAWEALGPGDTVRIHHRPDPYREKILIASAGTPSDPIRVCGIPNAKGDLPVIDGENATSRKADTYPYGPTQERGLIVLTRDDGDQWGFKPAHVTIQGLEVRNAAPPMEFTDPEGKKRSYTPNAAAVFVERGEHIAIRHCVIHGAGNGIFVASGREEESVSKRILIEHNVIYGNGNRGSDRHHNVYTEAAGMLMQHNRFGPPKQGAKGNNIKDRSAGTVFRYNHVQGGAHLLDLVEPEESNPLLRKLPEFDRAYVYGNVLEQGTDGASNLIHFGGDTGLEDLYRKGPLFFYHNTVVIRGDQKKLWRLSLFRLSTEQQSADVRNNVMSMSGTTNLLMMHTQGTVKLGVNWISADWKPGRDGFEGVLEGKEALVTGTDPGFMDRSKGDYRLTATSPCVDAAGPLSPDLPAEHHVKRQLGSNMAPIPRETVGKAADLGAFEHGL